MTQNVKQQLNSMYVGFVFVYWGDDEKSCQLGTAKQKSLQQMQSFAKTIDKKNPVFDKIKSSVDEMARSVSKQIMTDKSSDMVLDNKQKQQYKQFGQNQVATSKKNLQSIIEREHNPVHNNTLARQKEAVEKSKQQDMVAKRNAMQYRPTKTNEVSMGAKPSVTIERMDQRTLLQLLKERKMQNAA